MECPVMNSVAIHNTRLHSTANYKKCISDMLTNIKDPDLIKRIYSFTSHLYLNEKTARDCNHKAASKNNLLKR